MSDNLENKETEQDKQTNRTFTQSEADKLVKSQLERQKKELMDEFDQKLNNFKSQEDEKVKAQEAQKQKEAKFEQDTAGMNEMQKILHAMNEQKSLFQKEIESVRNQMNANTAISMKTDLLSEPKYRDLPEVYKNQIEQSSDITVMKVSADKMLDQFNADMAKLGKVSGNVGSVSMQDNTTTQSSEKINKSLHEKAKNLIAEQLKRIT